MGCCQSHRGDTPSLGQPGKTCEIAKQYPIRFGDFQKEELEKGIDCQIMCITKPELSYVLHINSDQLLNWSLQNLEERVITDFTDHMIESFSLSMQKQIQKKYYYTKLLEFIDLLPLYVELSCDETIACVEVEIEHSRSVVVLPYESSISLRELKKNIAEKVNLSLTQFELHLLEKPLVLDDMNLSECGISANCKLRLVQHGDQDDQEHDESTIHTSEWEGKKCCDDKKGKQEIEDLGDMPERQQEEVLSAFSEISMINRGDSGGFSAGQSFTELDESQKITVGLNIQVQCDNMNCNFYGLKQIFPLSLGEFIFSNQNSSTPMKCAHCSSPALPFQLLFFQCTYIVSGIYSRKIISEKCQQKQNKGEQTLDPKEQSQENESTSTHVVLTQPSLVTTRQSSGLIKFNQGQLISTDGQALENFSLDCENTEWKQLRVRVRPHLNQCLICSICTLPITRLKEQSSSLSCNHIFHSLCLARFYQKNNNLSCALCVF